MGTGAADFPRADRHAGVPDLCGSGLVPQLCPGCWWSSTTSNPTSPHVAESIERAGATVLPLPDSLHDDPIEELWSKFKGQLRRIAVRTKDGLYKAVGETLDSVTIQDLLSFTKAHCTQRWGKPR